MADAQVPHWSGYGSLAMVYEWPEEDAQRPAFPAIPSSPTTSMTPTLWSSPYPASSPSETMSPTTPIMSFSSYSPAAPYSPPLNSSKPHFSNISVPTSHSFGSQSPSWSPGSPCYSQTLSRLPAEPPVTPEIRPGPVVPQTTYTAPFSPGLRPIQIEFRSTSGVLGVPMRLLQGSRAKELPIEGANTIPFSESVASTITLRIRWPGYLQYSRRMTMRKGPRLLKLFELALAVYEVFREFVEEAREDPTGHVESKWRVGRGHITVNDLVLLRIYQVSQGSWQADVRLETERD